MIESDSKKRLFYIIVLVLTFIAMIISATIAYFSLVSSQKDEDTKLYTGKLEINYIDGTYIKNPTLWPMSKKPNYDTYNNVYRNTFKIVSSGTLEQTITVDMIVTTNTFDEDDIKYCVFNNKGKEMACGDVPLTGKVNLADNLYLSPDGTAEYTLILWLDNKDYNQNSDFGKVIAGKLSVLSKQLKR